MGTVCVTVPAISDPNKVLGESKHTHAISRDPHGPPHHDPPVVTADPFGKRSLYASFHGSS